MSESARLFSCMLHVACATDCLTVDSLDVMRYASWRWLRVQLAKPNRPKSQPAFPLLRVGVTWQANIGLPTVPANTGGMDTFISNTFRTCVRAQPQIWLYGVHSALFHSSSSDSSVIGSIPFIHLFAFDDPTLP